MSQAPEDLRDRLDAALPMTYPGLDLDAALQQGKRVVRRRRVGTALVAMVAVAAVAVGASVLGVGRRTAAPLPAAPSGAVTSAAVVPMQATLHVGGYASDPSPGGDRTVVVTVHRAADGSMSFDYTQSPRSSSGSFGYGGPALSGSGRRVMWVEDPDTSMVVGLVPSASAQHAVDLVTTGDAGSYTSDVQPVPGADFSAFAVRVAKPLTTGHRVVDVRWFDHAGRPVGRDGRVGSSASIDGRTAWMTADGDTIGVIGEVSAKAGSELPYLFVGDVESNALRMHLTIFGPPQAVGGTATLSDGRQLSLATVPLDARHSVARATYTREGTGGPTLVRYTWTDAQGQRHDITL